MTDRLLKQLMIGHNLALIERGQSVLDETLLSLYRMRCRKVAFCAPGRFMASRLLHSDAYDLRWFIDQIDTGIHTTQQVIASHNVLQELLERT